MKDKLRPATPGITFASGAVVEVPVERDNGQRALEAWKAWWQSELGDGRGNPIRYAGYGCYICAFCNGESGIGKGEVVHESDCPYLIVKAIAEEEGW